MTVSPLHVPYLGPSQTFVTKTEGVRYITDQYAALLSSVWGLADQDEEPLLSKHDDDIRLDRDNRMVESISRRTGQAVNTFKRRHHSRHSGRRPWHPTHKVNRRVVRKPPSFLSTLNKFSARKGLAPDKNLSPPSKPFRPPGKKPPAKKLRPPSQPYKPPKKFSKRPYLSQEPKPPRKPSISYLAPPEPTPYQVRMSSTTPLSFNSASGTTFISGSVLDPYALLALLGFLVFMFYIIYNFINATGSGRSNSIINDVSSLINNLAESPILKQFSNVYFVN